MSIVICICSVLTNVIFASSPSLRSGLSQGIRRFVVGLGLILGPLWVGGLLKHLYIMLGVMLALMVLVLVGHSRSPR